MELSIDKCSSFKVGNKIYKIPKELIPLNSYLYKLITVIGISVNKDVEGNIIISESSEIIPTFDAIYDYLVNGILPSIEYINNFDYFGLNYITDYQLILFLEDFMRDKMYQPEYASYSFNTNKYHHLIKIDREMWKYMVVPNIKNPNFLFGNHPPVKSKWKYIEKNLNKLNELLINDNIFIAGGSIFSILFGTHSSDIDIFLYGIDSVDAKDTIKKIYKMLSNKSRGYLNAGILKSEGNFGGIYRNAQQFPEEIAIDIILSSRNNLNKRGHIESHNNVYSIDDDLDVHYFNRYNFNITRTKNALTFSFGYFENIKDYQIILRLYQTPSEILHGFDVDCCCMGYNRDGLWMTQRCLYSLTYGYNTVNFNRMSPSYEYRLAKYGTRGMAIKVQNFDRSNINIESIGNIYEKTTYDTGYDSEYDSGFYSDFTIYRYLKNDQHKSLIPRPSYKKIPSFRLKGLDILIYLEYLTKSRLYHVQTLRAIHNLAEEASDYSHIPIKRSGGSSIAYQQQFLLLTADNYLSYSKDYIPFLSIDFDIRNHQAWEILPTRHLYTNTLKSTNFNFIKCKVSQHLQYIKNVERTDLDVFDNILLDISEHIYKGFGIVRPWDIPQTLEFKIINPGEQMTGTFHKTVFEDPNVWYQGRFYNYE